MTASTGGSGRQFPVQRETCSGTGGKGRDSASRALGEHVSEAAVPAEKRDNHGIQIRFLPFGGTLGRLPYVVWRAWGDGPIAVLARHIQDLPTVASHTSSPCAKLVASHR